jgi:hypothetical protein
MDAHLSHRFTQLLVLVLKIPYNTPGPSQPGISQSRNFILRYRLNLTLTSSTSPFLSSYWDTLTQSIVNSCQVWQMCASVRQRTAAYLIARASPAPPSLYFGLKRLMTVYTPNTHFDLFLALICLVYY